MKVERNYTEVVRINAPEWYADPAFRAWLDSPANQQATWHKKGEPPGDYSDLWFTYDSGEGCASDMPEHIWSQVEEALGQGAYLVWVDNLQ